MKKINKTLQSINFEPNNATIITRKHSVLNFGQTGAILGFDKFNDEVVFKAHGDSKKYNLHYTQIWPQTEAYNYEDRNKALDFLVHNNL